MKKRDSTSAVKATMGANIRRIRVQQELSLSRFALMVGLDYEYVSLIEKGYANPTINVIEKIASGLDVEVVELLLPTQKL